MKYRNFKKRKEENLLLRLEKITKTQENGAKNNLFQVVQ